MFVESGWIETRLKSSKMVNLFAGRVPGEENLRAIAREPIAQTLSGLTVPVLSPFAYGRQKSRRSWKVPAILNVCRPAHRSTLAIAGARGGSGPAAGNRTRSAPCAKPAPHTRPDVQGGSHRDDAASGSGSEARTDSGAGADGRQC